MKMFGWKTWVLAVTIVLLPYIFRPTAIAADGSTETVTGTDSLTSLFTDGTFKAVIKTLWFARDFDSDKTDMSTLAIGGNLYFETAPLYGFSGGIGFKTSQGDLLDEDDTNIYSGLLAVGDDAVLATAKATRHWMNIFCATTTSIPISRLTPFPWRLRG